MLASAKKAPIDVLPDANIWASATLHSWFGVLAMVSRGTFRFFWTEDILAEAIHARRRRFPFSTSTQMEQLRERLLAVMGENQIRDFPVLRHPGLPDPLDAHVHSAAVHGGIDVLITENVRDFKLPSGPLTPYEVQTPDEWLIQAAREAPDVFDLAILKQIAFREAIGRSLDAAGALQAAGCPMFAGYVDARFKELHREEQRRRN